MSSRFYSNELFTARVQPQERAQAWGRSLTEIFAARPVEIDDEEIYDGKAGEGSLINLTGVIKTRRFPRLSISRIVATGHSIKLRTGQLPDALGRALVVLQLRGTTTFVVGNRPINLACGQMALLPASPALKISSPSDFEVLVVDWQDQEFQARTADRDPVDSILDARAPLHRVLAHYIGLLAANAGLNDQSDFTTKAVETAGRLLEMAFAAPLSRRKEPDREPVMSLEVIRHFIDHSLHDPELSAETIATSLGCSKSTLYREFKNCAQDETISRYMWRRRVERCAELLMSGNHGGTLMQLANSLGFSNDAHFSRTFKRHMGIGPLAFMRQAQGSLAVSWQRGGA